MTRSRTWAERIRDDLAQDERITRVELVGAPRREISIEVPQRNLRAYGLTIDQVASTVRMGSVELPAGTLRTSDGDVLLRTTERRDLAPEFADLTVIGGKDGTVVRLGDIGTVVDGYEETDQYARFNGLPALLVRVHAVGQQTPLEIAGAVQDYLGRAELPLGLQLAIWDDASETYGERMELLLDNAYLGLALVLAILGLFLQLRLAFWVTLGIPISFLGSLFFLPMADVSLNMVSMFAFILTLGIVVLLAPETQRTVTARTFCELWRERVGSIPGAHALQFEFERGVSAGADVSVDLTHADPDILRDAARVLAAALARFEGVTDIDDGTSIGKQQLNFTLLPAARSLGITEDSLARQVRIAFFGDEALRQVRSRDEIRVYVRLPASERAHRHGLDNLLLRTADGGEVPNGSDAQAALGSQTPRNLRPPGPRQSGRERHGSFPGR